MSHMTNPQIAQALDEIADLLEIRGDNAFRVRAYRNAARVISGQRTPIAGIVTDEAEDPLRALPGIGADLAGKIHQLADSGHLALLDELRQETPPGLRALLAVPGLGPKRVRAIHETLGVGTVDALAVAAAAGRLREVPGIGVTLERRILDGLRGPGGGARARVPRGDAERQVAPILARLREAHGLARLEVAGSLRRRARTVGDVDLLAAADPSDDVIRRFVTVPGAAVLAAGTTRAAIQLPTGLQVDLRVVPEASWGAALLYFTGSKAHNVRLRRLAQRLGLKLNEYGLYRDERLIAGATEADVYAALGLPYLEPELRVE